MLLEHFIRAIAPSYVRGPFWSILINGITRMDISDPQAYFGRHLPLRAKHNSMLRLAAASVTARYITRLSRAQLSELPTSDLPPRLRGGDIVAGDAGWYYKAADFYDEAISHLRLHLHSFNQAPEHAQSGSHATSTATLSSDGDPPSKKRRKNSSRLSTIQGDVLSAIAIFSRYEMISGHTIGWRQCASDFVPTQTIC